MSPVDRTVPLPAAGSGYFYREIAGVEPGAHYKFRLDSARELPDPASRHQPLGVHGPSAVTASEFAWTDQQWTGLPLRDFIIYELHTGAFTPEGTFDAIIERLDYLIDLGITAVELMPVAQFPGSRNWGYDGVYPFAVQASYGGPAGLKRFVNAAHAKHLAIVLDVVYNHLGPEGNYLGQYGHYFTDRYTTPWGQAVNFDGQHSSEVRRYVLENAVQWIEEFHIDALRLDAIHTIHDTSGLHILQEVAAAVRRCAGHRLVYTIAESDLNDVSIVRPASEGGYGLDAQWSDDFHHSLHSVLTGERLGYYQDFGSLHHLAKAYEDGFVYTGQFSQHRDQPHGTPSRDIPAGRFVVCAQNHDQVGNRVLGERLNHLLFAEELKLAAGSLILSPFVPMLFMGQEYAEAAPFLYFVDHSDPALIEAVREGRRREFAAFAVTGDLPDAQAEETFAKSKLRHELRADPKHRAIYDFYRELIRLRKTTAALRNLSKDHCNVTRLDDPAAIVLWRWFDSEDTITVLHFGSVDASFRLSVPAGSWRKRLDSAEARWLGPGATMPEQAHSDGAIEIHMPRKSVCLLVKAP
jgi:maltooligosyltrehalose trehalohydrolase